jgi:uncharacterized protein
MLRVDLGQLAREGTVVVEGAISPDDDIWSDSDLRWAGDVELRLTAAHAGTGEVVVRGAAEGTLDQDCRRCLRAVETDVEEELTLVFSSEAEPDSDAYPFDAGAPELDLSDAVREELILAVNQYVVCDPECRGLCPKCGANLNEESCDCTEDETDPRWAALRALKDR